MSEDKKHHYLGATRNDIGKLYEEVSMVVKEVLKQPSAIIKPVEINTLMIILDEKIVGSERFRDFLHKIKDKVKRIIGIYIPEEEDIINKLKELGEDKKSILKALREFEREKEHKIIEELGRIGREEDIAIDIEVMHKPRLQTITELCGKENPDLIIMSKVYTGKELTADFTYLINELIKHIKCPILLII